VFDEIAVPVIIFFKQFSTAVDPYILYNDFIESPKSYLTWTRCNNWHLYTFFSSSTVSISTFFSYKINQN